MTVRSRRPLRRNLDRKPSRNLHHETLEKRELLAGELGALSNPPRLISVSANAGEQFDMLTNNQLRTAPTELRLRFDGSQQLDPSTFSGIQFRASGGDGSFGEGNERIIRPGFLGFETEASSRVIVARFAETLPDDQYVLEIAGYDDTNAGIVGLRNLDGTLFMPQGVTDPDRPVQRIQFNVEVGPKVVAVVPQPIVGTGASREQLRNQIHVFFNNDPLSNPAAGVVTGTGDVTDPTVVQPRFYHLFLTGDTVETGDDTFVTPSRVSYDPALNRAVLEFPGDDLLDLVPAGQAGTFRLRIGSSQPQPITLPPITADRISDVGDTFAEAHDIGVAFGTAGDSSIVVSGEIEATRGNTMRWPGINSPGVRDDRRDAQVVGRADTTDGINVFYYNFASLYGTDAIGNTLNNAITPAQQQRTREILDLYALHLGVQFIETENRGLQIVTGDLRALVETATTGPGAPYQEFRVNDADPSRGVLILDAGENWFDGYGLSPDSRPSWFVEALRGVGSLLGIGNTFEQVPGVASGSNPALYNASMFPLADGSLPPDFSIEPDFLSTSDIIPGQALHRPEIKDADLYKFQVSARGTITIESFAQRLLETSLLDTDLKLWKLDSATGAYELVARNQDFFGTDSYISIEVGPEASGASATYVVGITAKGNDRYNPNIAGSGGGGRSQGIYDLRIHFKGNQVGAITDTNGSRLDGNSDGAEGGDFNFWFRVAAPKDTAAPGQPRTLFVNRSEGSDLETRGTVDAPYATINYAFDQALPGDIVRLLPDGGADGLISTTDDNLAYEIGRGGSGNAVLADGETFEVPRGVTVMIDAGAILKLRNAKISVGSESADENRSLAALQILGAPVIIDQDGSVVDGTVQITSYNEERRDGVLMGIDTNALPTTPAPGDWAGIEFRNDFDFSEGRPVWETEGIFLDYVSHADIRYGGGSVTLQEPSVAPLELRESRPTLIYNRVSNSREAAMSADPNSFRETNFHAPIYQQASLDRFGTTFTSDYDRVGPLIRGNTIVDNSINGLFVRVVTPAAGEREPMTVSGRFDDRDIVHVLSEVLVLQGATGGPLLLEQRPDVLSVTVDSGATPGGDLLVGSLVDYRVTFVTDAGYESLASEPTRSVTVGAGGAVVLNNLPAAPAMFAGRKLYRRTPSGDYQFVAQLDRGRPDFIDNGQSRGGLLAAAALASGSDERLLARFDARLSIDPGVVVKMDSARIEVGFGADFYAEGTDGNPVVFTSRLDDRYGAGGTFDTNNDGAIGTPAPGDWSGLVLRQGSTGSIDHAIIAFGGGESSISGGFTEFNAVEILQADVRIANSTFDSNADGFVPGSGTRDGIGFNGSATIFIRGAQPIIVGNTIINNEGAGLSINPDALNYLSVSDPGRSTGPVDRFITDLDNQGPLIAANQFDNNNINGMLIRNEALTTESVWDDTDVVHVVEGHVYAWNHHHRSGLRLKSDPNQSLVVKFQNGGSLNASRVRTDVEDSIGGTIQVLGQPGFPVIMTSIHDDSVGAGFTPDGLPQTNTDNANIAPGIDWRGIVINAGANDRNVAFVLETERAIPTSSAENAIPGLAQMLGSLAQSEKSSDENRRLGFNVRGTLSQNGDIDVYSFMANGGTEVYLDIDDTHFGLDTIVELIDINGNILALSNSSHRESVAPHELVNNIGPGRVLPLRKSGLKVVEGPNPLDAGMRVILPGNNATLNQYYVRVRSSNLRPGDPVSRLTDPGAVGQGQSHGQYLLGIRLRETDEIAGSTVRLADIRYAFNPIDLPAAPSNSPLVSEFAERVGADGLDLNDAGTAFDGTEGTASFTNASADPLGSISQSNRGVLRVSGVLGNQVATTDPQFGILREQDIDVFRVDLFANRQEPDIIGENRFISTVFDIDYADQLGRANTSLAVYTAQGRLILHGRDSNVADDQGRPGLGVDMTNLKAGSAGTLDAFIGPVELQEGTYYVVVSSAQMIPQTLNQLFVESPTASNVRILPIDSVRRVAEEDFSSVSLRVNDAIIGNEIQALNYTADRPMITPLFDETSLVPYKLEDVRMFLTLNRGLTGTNRSTVITVDPFTGKLERTLGQFAQPVGDLAMRRDGELFAYSLGPNTGDQTNANTGNFLNVSSVDGSTTNSGDDGLTFQRNNVAGDNTEADDNAQLLINAMAFVPSNNNNSIPGNNPTIPAGERLLALGDRDNTGRANEIPDSMRRNIVYSMVANNGAATNQGNTNANLDRSFAGNAPFNDSFGAASNKQELGIVDTGQFDDSPADPDGNFVNALSITGIAMDPTQGANFVYGVTQTGYVFTFNPTNRRTIDIDGDPLNEYNRVINATNHGQITPHPNDLDSRDAGNVQFTGLTLGPRITERAGTTGLGPYARVLFGVTASGWIYTMQIDPATNRIEPAHVLFNGNYAIPMVNQFGLPLNETPTGVAFSIREENLWHQTTDRGTSFAEQHGGFVSHNQTRLRTLGGSSLYFGVQIDANAANNTIEGGNGVLNPGGAHGSVVSRPMNLENYDAGDKPTLYFSYFLETENGQDYSPPSNGINNQQVDAFRVFAAGDDGQWRLLTTNNTFRSFSNFISSDEYDYFAVNGGIPVQEAFDNTDDWRQARVDLSPLAGHKNVQIRFDFSTAGGMHSQFVTTGYLTELQAAAGMDIIPGTGFTLANSHGFESTRFEFVRGAAVNVPAPALIANGQRLTFTEQSGVNRTVILTRGPVTGPNQILIEPTDTSANLAAKVVARLQTVAPDLNAIRVGSRIVVSEAASFTVDPVNMGGTTASQYLPNGNVPIFYSAGMSSVQVRDAIRNGLANGIGFIDPVTGLSTATAANFPEYGTNRIRTYNQTLISNTSAIGFSRFLPGDEFGAAASRNVSNAQTNPRPAENNNIEGVYIDDIVIGFAERGEMIFNAPVNRNFVVLPETRTSTFTDTQVPEFPNEILIGGYTLEIRTASEYGVPEDYDPIRLALNEQLGFGRSFDTNDRLSDGVTLIIPAAADLVDGDLFVLGNGSQRVTFEFDDNNSVTPGHVRIPMTPKGVGDAFNRDVLDANVLATAVRNAINSPQAVNVLGIRAAGRDSRESGRMRSNRVELFGDFIEVNPTSGRFIKLDLVAEETFYGRESARTLPAVDHENRTVFDSIFFDTFARASVTDYINGMTDTLVAVGKIGDNVGTQGSNVLIAQAPELDVDVVKIFLNAGDVIDVDLDTVGWSLANPFETPRLLIFDEGQNLVADSVNFSATAPGETHPGAWINDFRAAASGYYYVAVTSDYFFGGGLGFGEYQLTIRPGTVVSNGVTIDRDVLMVDYHFGKGDTNRFRDQGQIIIESNFISNFGNTGIRATFNPGPTTPSEPLDRRPGASTLLRNENSDRLIPGAVIMNNVVIADGNQTGIVFSGEVASAGSAPPPVPFGRLVNNTVVGNGGGTGILVNQNSSPTVLNNVIAGFNVGLNVAGNSASTVRGGNAFHRNATDSNVALATSSFVIADELELFQDPARGIYIPAAGSAVIDSSFASLNDRSNFVNTVKQPVGISSSPIIAPVFDAYGIPRFDDPNVTTPGGVGSNVFIDRGAIDRADLERPIASLVNPMDFILGAGTPIAGGDTDPAESFVRIREGSVEFFEIQLTDPSGTGPDADTINTDTVLLTENGRALTAGTDYVFGYSDNSRTIRLTPLAGLWRPDAVYEITLNNQNRVSLTLPSGNLIKDGDQVIIQDSSGAQGVFEFDSGYSIRVPQTTTLVINGANLDFVDGDLITIEAPGGNALTFEINRSGSVASGNVAVDLSVAGTIRAVRDAFMSALNSSVPGVSPSTAVSDYLQLNPVAIGNDRIQLGTAAEHVVSGLISGLAITGQPGGISDGDTFTYTAGNETVTFEFTTDGVLADSDFREIPFSPTDTPDQIAAAIVAAIAPTNLGLIGAQTISGGVVLLGGDAADVLDVSHSALELTGLAGVSSGAIPVTFLPTAQFSALSAAATLQSAILQSSLNVNTFAPGGGTLFISGAQSIGGTVGGSSVASLGSAVPAITDLAGNPVRETRINNETRFTIIMPQVLFDFGDAGDIGLNYATLLADDGPRHTISGDRLPRLGRFVDTEEDGQPGPDQSDDAPISFSVTETGGVFNVPASSINPMPVSASGSVPVGGETLTLTVAGVPTTFQWIESTSNPQAGNVPVIFVPTDSPADLTTKLVTAIRGNVSEVGTALLIEIDADDPTLFSITAIDDEDGVSVGTFVSGGANLQVFTIPESPTTVTADEVLGFLNPADPAGTSLAVFVTGTGLLDAWVDFNRNGVFDPNEQVLKNTPVVDGWNILTVVTPSDAIGSQDRVDTWMRFRISSGGNLLPTGIAVGGEVEDYRISVIRDELPQPVDDSFEVDEDQPLIVDSSSPVNLFSNDQGVSNTLLPTRMFIGQQPKFGTIEITDAFNGEFIYRPFPGADMTGADFYGVDTFTYRLSTQENNSPGAIAASTFATVTINVRPVNDAPLATNKSFHIQEGGSRTFSAAALLEGGLPDATPNATTAPQDESNQELFVNSVSAGGLTISAANPTAVATTSRGAQVTAIFDANNNIESVTVTYPADLNFNSDNPAVTDQFEFTLRDDGISILPPDLVLTSPVVPNPLVSNVATVTLTVTPQNDAPVLGNDLVSLFSTTDTSYRDYYEALDLTPPAPTEDEPLLIPGDFLLSNDLNGPVTAVDEIQGIRDNDGPLSIIGASIDPALGTVIVTPGGDILFTPADDIYGEVVFSYTAQDQGFSEMVDPVTDEVTRVSDPRTATAFVTVFLAPVNDPPVAFDRSLSMAEAVEPGTAELVFTKSDLINGSGVSETTAIAATANSITLPDGSGLVDGETMRVVDMDGNQIIIQFNTTGVPSVGINSAVMFAATDSADAIAARLHDALLTFGFNVSVVDATVNFVNSITVTVGELPALPGDFAPTLGAPFNESVQGGLNLNVVAFSTNAGTVDVDDPSNGLVGGTGILALDSDEGGTLEFEFADGQFVRGVYRPAVDYNQRTPFAPVDVFTYIIADNGRTRFADGSFLEPDLPGERSLVPATVTLTVTQVNDPPVFDTQAVIDILEDVSPSVVANVITNWLPGPSTALDELERQTVTFSIDMARSTVPSGLMSAAPDVSMTHIDGSISFFPATDAVGTAVYVIVGTDDDPTDPRSTEATFTVNVRPVNDAPRFNPAVAGTSDAADPDEAYSVGRDEVGGVITAAPITYTLREDNTQALGATEPYFIPLQADASIVGYRQIGLLDVFVAGPANEIDETEGGSQVLELFNFPSTTEFGGTLSAVMEEGQLIGLNYVPPLNFNNQIGSFDTFIYTVRDGSTTGGETFDLELGELVSDRLTRSNQVRFNLNPVNDRPEFTTTIDRIEVREDSGVLTIPGYAIDINAGPPLTAFDEVDFNTGQNVTFSVTSLGFSEEQSELYFSEFPTVSPAGQLRFKPAPNVFGTFEFDVVATDDGPGNAARGDLFESFPQRLTIVVQPVNDPPRVDPSAEPLAFELLEDGTLEILVNGDGINRGLLDVFLPGPANESADITPGGNQTVSLGTPIPTSSAQGGSLTPIIENGQVTRLRYTPRADFNGTDSFIYTVIDDGVTVDINTGGVARPDPRIASNTVSLVVLPVNDAPRFGGAGNVEVDEDDGSVSIANWATNVLAGPPTAFDEIGIDGDGQALEFVITQIGGDTDLFATEPAAVITGDSAALTFVTAPDANGEATFEVFLRDDGPNDASIGDQNTSATRTFTIRINAVNDPPTFTPGGLVTVKEDSGPFIGLWATDVSPGPPDEQSQSVRFEVVTPIESQGLFQALPTISDEGILRFTPATNASGTVDLQVRAIDSEGGVSDAVTLQIIIIGVNDPPIAVPDVFTNQITSHRPLVGSTLLNGQLFDANQTVNEDQPLVIPVSALLANDIDPDLLTDPDEFLTIVMPAESFSVSGARVTYDAIAGTITYDPTVSLAAQSLAPGQNLLDTFTYSIRDAAGAMSNLTTVSLNVAGVNDAPWVQDDAPQFNPNGPTIFNPLLNDTDVDGTIDPTSIQITLQPAFGSLTIDFDGTVTYTPFGAFTGEDIFRYTVADNLGDRSQEATVTLSANAAPIARNDQAAGLMNEPLVINVAANDEDPDGSLDLTSIVIVTPPRRGQAVPLGDGTIRYVPATGFVGFDSFQYSIADDQGRFSEAADVNVRIVASTLQNPDDHLDVNGDGFVTALDALLVINLLSRSNTSEIPVSPTDRGPNYYDVNGDQRITALDAFRVINVLSRGPSGGNGAEGEMPSVESGVVASPLPRLASVDSIDIGRADWFAGVSAPLPLPHDVAKRESEVDFAQWDFDRFDSVAIDLIARERDADQEEDETLVALDAAMAAH